MSYLAGDIKPIEWWLVEDPNDTCAYTHLKGNSGLGSFLITWKSWKKNPSYDVEESPWGWLGSGFGLEEAKGIAERVYAEHIKACVSQPNETQKLDKLHKRTGEIEYSLFFEHTARTPYEIGDLLLERAALEAEIEGYNE